MTTVKELMKRVLAGPPPPRFREDEQPGSYLGITGRFADVPALQIRNDLDNLLGAYSGIMTTLQDRLEQGDWRREETEAKSLSFRLRARAIRGVTGEAARQNVALYEEVAEALATARAWLTSLPELAPTS